MALRRYRKSPTWHYQCTINGRKWSRSTGETDKRRARRKVPELRMLAELHKKRPEKSLKLSRAIVAEVERIEADVSSRAAERTSHCLKNFLKWLGKDVLLEKISTDLLDEYQCSRLRRRSTSTVKKEVYAVRSLPRQHGFTAQKPRQRVGRRIEQRPLSNEELKQFFGACRHESCKTLFLVLLCTGARPAEIIPSTRSNHVALLKKEVDVEKGSVLIRTAKLKRGQRDRQRIVGLPMR